MHRSNIPASLALLLLLGLPARAEHPVQGSIQGATPAEAHYLSFDQAAANFLDDGVHAFTCSSSQLHNGTIIHLVGRHEKSLGRGHSATFVDYRLQCTLPDRPSWEDVQELVLTVSKDRKTLSVAVH